MKNYIVAAVAVVIFVVGTLGVNALRVGKDSVVAGARELLPNSVRKSIAVKDLDDYPQLALVGKFGKIPLAQSSTAITRELLGGVKAVSARHSVIRRTGPEYRLEDLSANGTYRWLGDRWLQCRRIPNC